MSNFSKLLFRKNKYKFNIFSSFLIHDDKIKIFIFKIIIFNLFKRMQKNHKTHIYIYKTNRVNSALNYQYLIIL